MKTIKLSQQKQKLSGQIFDDVKAGKMEHPLENYVSINCKYTHSTRGLIPVWIHIAGETKQPTIESGWSSLPPTMEELTNLECRDEVETPWGKYTLYDNHGTAFPVIILPHEKILD